MGIGGISIWQLLIILVIVLLLFGTKKLRGIGGDIGSAIKSFKKAVTDDKSAEIAGKGKASKSNASASANAGKQKQTTTKTGAGGGAKKP